jgi:hypothetical protein
MTFDDVRIPRGVIRARWISARMVPRPPHAVTPRRRHNGPRMSAGPLGGGVGLLSHALLENRGILYGYGPSRAGAVEVRLLLGQTAFQRAWCDGNPVGELPPGGDPGSGSDRQSVASTVAKEW